ncbi:GNAT family N-acetyltransferase [Phyllobacterium salinisoli]|uniref:GNAT family N-acetyltransferase n=1 Tax=Phyllobacterium salinisoli TaxID=1899321 RepID=A0A368K1G5_9HYPH|nr:GNAT family N-acetyltransferase [Phyllobacterium salinisoli]RCS23219.1 GNAT family N-acetyltransferase [Phyllobacterium salinisoli]
MSEDTIQTVVRPAEAGDENKWRALFAAYNAFYRASVPEAVIATTWKRILDPGSDVKAVIAERGGEIIGFANYLFHASTWSDRPNCYLEDLFVDPAARGGGAARKLIEGVEAAARVKNAFRIYWHTQEYNAPARSLYDTITPRSSFIVYRKAL